jgi:hypothetical protein
VLFIAIMAVLLVTGLLCVAALLELTTQGRAIPVARSAWRLIIGSLVLAVVGHICLVFLMQATRGQLADYYLGEAIGIAAILFWLSVAGTLIGALVFTIILRYHRPVPRNAVVEYAVGAVVVVFAAMETFIYPFVPAPIRAVPFILVGLLLVGAVVGTVTDFTLSRHRGV